MSEQRYNGIIVSGRKDGKLVYSDNIFEKDRGKMQSDINKEMKTRTDNSFDSLKQTKQSAEDGGENVITLTRHNGTSEQVKFYNGSKGSKGDKGDKGDKGTAGTDAYTVELQGAPITISTSDDGVPSGTTSGGINTYGYATVVCRKGGAIVSASSITIKTPVNCTASVSGTSVRINSIRTYYASSNTMYYTDGYVDVSVVVGGKAFVVRLTWHLDYTKYFGGLKADAKKMQSNYTELTNKVDGMPLQTNSALQQYSSEILQSAREISLKVGYTLAERRNLLVGSLFRKQGEGCDLLRSKIYCTSAHEGANVVFAPDAKLGGARWGEASNSRNIHVTKGKTYTLAFWARTKSAKVVIMGEVVWHSSATDTSRPSGYTGPNGSANLGVAMITPSNGWYLYQKTFTVAANAPYEWVSVACVKVEASTASQQVYIAHPILIEGTAEDFMCWSASPNDYNYIGGNLLDNTRTLNKTGNLTRMDASVATNESYNNGCSVIYADAASKYIEMAQWNVNTIIKKDEDYIFSFMAKGSGSIDAYMWSGSNLSIFAEDSERDTTTSNADGGRRFSLTSEWKRYWVHWRSDGTGIPNYVLIRCIQGSKAWVTMPKLEVGATPTDWIGSANGYVEDSGIVAKLLRTGLDIENGKITATADNFEVRNNSGEVTARVNEKGLLEVGAGLFSGFVKKKKIIITPENIDQYRIPAASLSVMLFDFTNAGSFVEFQGDFFNYFKTDQVNLILPFYNPKDNLYNLHGVPTDEALQYVGQTLIIKNRANVTFVVHGGGTINKRGTTTSTGILKVNEISSDERLIATCEVTTAFGNSTSGANPNRLTAVRWNGNIYG